MTRILNLLFKISKYFVRTISMLQSMNIVKELHCMYTYKISFQLHWPSCIESESPDGISYSGSHQIEKEIFLLLTIDYLKAIEKLGLFFSCQETPTLPFFLAIAAFEWSVCCIDSFVMLNYIDIKSSIIGQLRSVGAVVMFIESNRKWCCLEPGILFYFVWQ